MMSKENTTLPFISSLLVTYNESKYIERALESLLVQDYPKDSYEIIIIDGGSTDDTISLAKRLTQNYIDNGESVPQVSYLENPNKILAAGWNIGIKAAKGEYVVRIDAHATANTSFIRLAVETMMDVDAACVGGKLITKASNETGEIIKDVLSSPFGVGNSSFRTSNETGYADTAVYGLYDKRIFDKVGYFDENLVRNQDIELHSRIKRADGKFYFEPKIESTYYSRDSVKKMIKQAFGNGLWNIVILKKNNAKLSLRHVVPFFFVLFLIVATLAGLYWRPAWHLECAMLILYLILALLASLERTQVFSRVIKMPGLFFLLHISYGFGSLVGLAK